MRQFWYISAVGDQQAWQDFCEEFMSTNITMMRTYRDDQIVSICRIDLNPYASIDSTGSMPSFVDQAKAKGFEFTVMAEM